MTARLPVTVSSVQTWFYMYAYVKKSSPGSTQLPTSRHLLSPPTCATMTHTHTRINRLWSPLAYGLGGNNRLWSPLAYGLGGNNRLWSPLAYGQGGNKIVYYQHLLVSSEELLSLRLSDHFALVVGCINNN